MAARNAITGFAGCWPSVLGLALLGENLGGKLLVGTNQVARDTYFSRGSKTFIPMTIPRGKDAVVWRSVRNGQNCVHCQISQGRQVKNESTFLNACLSSSPTEDKAPLITSLALGP